MGNLCSSGTERADKKDENRVLDKPRDGEGEALLTSGDAEVAVGPEGVQVSVEGGGGGEGGGGAAGGGFGGFLGGAVKSGESAFNEVSRNIEEEGQRAATNAFQAGKDATGQVVEDVQTSAKAAVTEAGASVQKTVQESITRGVDEVKTQASEVYQSAAGKLEGAVQNVTGSLTSGVANVAGSAQNQAQTLEQDAGNVRNTVELSAANVAQEAGNVRSSVELSVANVVQEAGNVRSSVELSAANVAQEAGNVRSSVEMSAANVAQEASSTVDSAASSVHPGAESLNRNIDSLESETASADTEAENVRSQVQVAAEVAAVPGAGGGIFGSVQGEFGSRVDEVQAAAKSLAESVENTAENKANEVLESARQSASESFASWGESAQQRFSGLAGGFSSTGQTQSESIKDSTQATEDTARSTFRNIQQSVVTEAGSVDQSIEGVKGSFSDSFSNTQENFQQASVQGVEQVETSVDRAAESGVTNVRNSFGQSMDQVREYVQDITTASSQKLQELSNQATGAFSFIQGTTTNEADNVRRSITEDVQSERLSKDLTNAEELTGSSVEASVSSQNQLSQDSSDLLSEIQAAAKDVLSDEQEVGEQSLDNLEGLENAGSAPSTTDDLESDENFLDKARTLLEAHRNSLDGNRIPIPSVSIIEDNDGSNTHDSDLAYGAESASQEATAREFVESIIEKATSLVAESLDENEPVSESSSPSDPSVERGEETLAPKKRGVMFASPQISERSSSSLSSAQDISPPPPHESDLSPPGDSSSSSISQGDLVETDELLIPPTAPADYSLNESNNNNNNIINNNVEDDDESIQRVAMEVTAKAVQDAIKIVSENGTGTIISSDIISNDVGISSPSSPDNEDDETTTDSSQVERGSPVSDLTDTSAHGSVSESLSSYDPGAVFRQDVANLSDLASSPGDWGAQSTADTKSSGKAEDLINFEDVATAHEETPTPTNSTPFDTYQHPVPTDDQSKSEVNPSNPFSSEVPSSLPPLDEPSSPSSPNKPTIIINSPDSAHHTNGSSEDVSSPQNEALI